MPESSTRFRHHRGNKLPHDVVVVDETSMVSLTMMARLLESVRPDARLVLVGDPDQLASVEAGAVLSDLVQGSPAPPRTPSPRCAPPTASAGSIGALAEALRAGDADGVLALLTLRRRRRRADRPRRPRGDRRSCATCCVQHALAVREAALAGDAEAAVAATDDHRLLCAHRDGPCGVNHWNRQVERWLGEATGQPVGAVWGQEWYAGRPLLVTANDYGLGLFNGDTGVVVREDDELRAVVAGVGEHLPLRDLPALRRRDAARDDGPQEPGQPGRARSPCCCRRRTPRC